MEDNIKKQLNKLIAEELPKAVGEQLQKRLKEATDLEARVEELEVNVTTLNVMVDDKQSELKDCYKEIQGLKDLKNSAYDNLTRSRVLDKQELSIEVFKANLQRDEAIKRSDDIKELSLGLVRNTSFRKSTFDNPIHGVHYNSNGQDEHYLQNNNTETTESVE